MEQMLAHRSLRQFRPTSEILGFSSAGASAILGKAWEKCEKPRIGSGEIQANCRGD
jgi:hypothetical protein